jgi:hypothetical protein
MIRLAEARLIVNGTALSSLSGDAEFALLHGRLNRRVADARAACLIGRRAAGWLRRAPPRAIIEPSLRHLRAAPREA